MNPYRSEFIQALAESLKVLNHIGDPLPRTVATQYPKVVRAIEYPSSPVVLELRGISLERGPRQFLASGSIQGRQSAPFCAGNVGDRSAVRTTLGQGLHPRPVVILLMPQSRLTIGGVRTSSVASTIP